MEVVVDRVDARTDIGRQIPHARLRAEVRVVGVRRAQRDVSVVDRPAGEADRARDA